MTGKKGFSPEEQRLLEAVLAGELDAEAAPVQAAAAASEGFARELASLLATQRAIDSACDLERAAGAEPPAASDGRVRAAVLQQAGPRAGRPPRGRWVLAAAGLLAVLWFAAPEWWSRAPGTDTPLSADFAVTVDPGYAAVRWDCPLPPGWTFRVEVRDSAAAPDRPPLATATVTAGQWLPPATASWPATVVVSVQQCDQSGALRRSSAAVRASR